MGVRRLLSASTLAAALGATLAGAPAIAQTTVTSDWISLGDIAPVVGIGADILLGPAPPPGGTLALDPAFIVAVAKKSGVIVALPMNDPILVTRASNAPAAPQAARAPEAPRATTPAAAPRPASFVPANAAPDGWAMVLARDVERGQVLAPEDIGWADPATLRSSRATPTALDAAVGMEARRTLKAGSALAVADLKSPTVIRKGDPVKLIYATPGLRLTVDGLAQADAAAGDSVRVLNSFSKRTIEAQAVAAGEARVMQR